MVRFSRMLPWASVAVLGLVAVTGWGQPSAVQPGGTPQRGGGRGGMMGMMFGGAGGSISVNDIGGTLLQMEAVQKELELVDDQKAKFKEVGDDLRAQFGKLRDLPQAEREAKQAELFKTIHEKIEKATQEVLLPHQTERLRELAIQRMGPLALADPKVQEDLQITADQKAQLSSIQQSMQAKQQEFRAGFANMRNLDADARQKAFQEMRPKMEAFRTAMDDAGKQALAVLTPAQQDSLEKMKGKKFEFPQNTFGGRRGGGQPGASQSAAPANNGATQ
jgi:hypothetical protein